MLPGQVLVATRSATIICWLSRCVRAGKQRRKKRHERVAPSSMNRAAIAAFIDEPGTPKEHCATLKEVLLCTRGKCTRVQARDRKENMTSQKPVKMITHGQTGGRCVQWSPHCGLQPLTSKSWKLRFKHALVSMECRQHTCES